MRKLLKGIHVLPQTLIFYVKNESHVRLFDIRLVFTFPTKDSTLQYKKCAHL